MPQKRSVITLPPPTQPVSAVIRIGGMTCESCALLLERKFRAVPGVVRADVHFRKGIARLHASGNALPSSRDIEEVIRAAGYRVLHDDAAVAHPSSVGNRSRAALEIGAALIIVFAVGKLLAAFDLVSLAPSAASALTLGSVFVIGLVAGTSSCLAVTGGLLLAIAAGSNALSTKHTAWSAFQPLLSFNAGRLLSYFVLGGVIGTIGQAVTLTPRATGIMTIAIAMLLLSLALSILGLVPRALFGLRFPKRLSHFALSLSESTHPAAPFAVGALTFFLPCGFTQSLQLVALASGSFLTGALTMFVFALGTLPSLLGISALSSVLTGRASHIFLRLSGAAVLLLAVINLRSGLALAGVDFSLITTRFRPTSGAAQQLPPVVDGYQRIAVTVMPDRYSPDPLIVKAGIPVRWTIDGRKAAGCTSELVVPSLGIRENLIDHDGISVVEFVPGKTGTIAFSCSMGMVRGSITVL